ncbi:hypothetical protein BGX34_000254, partial [Mortierella sp. NVP85]
SNSGRWLVQDIAMIDKVVNSVRASDDSSIEYVLIINQIHKDHWQYCMNQETLDMIVGKLVENFVANPRPGFSTILPCPHVPNPSENEMLKNKLLSAFKMSLPYQIKIVKIEAEPDDMNVYEKALIILLSPVWLPVLGVCVHQEQDPV